MKIHQSIKKLPRSKVVTLLEANSIQCYDHESDHVLKVALQECVASGDMTIKDIEDHLDETHE